MKQVLKSSVSIVALCMMVNTAWGMDDSREREGFKGRPSIGKDWVDDGKSVASNAFTERSHRSAKKEEPSYYDEEDTYTVRTDLDDIEVNGQDLIEIIGLKKHFFKGNLEITPQNYEVLTQHTALYTTAFKMFDKGVVIKGWKSSLGFEPLADLLYTFQNLKIFKVNIKWDKEEDVSEPIARAIQFYKNLTELDISNCKLTDEVIVDIMESVADPKKLSLLNVTGNKLSKETLTNLKKHFPNLASFKSDINLEMEKSQVPAVHSLSLKEKKEPIEKSSAMELIPQMKLNVTERQEKPYIPNASGVVNRPVVSDIVIPEIAKGYEEIYRRFVMGKLIYKPDSKSDKGRIELPIRALANPLEGTFDLSQCGDSGKYLSISTGYRKGKKAENASKVEVWIAPRFLVDKEMPQLAKNHHIRAIGGNWDAVKAPIGIFWTWGGWDAENGMSYGDYLTTESMEELGCGDFVKKYRASASTHASCSMYLWLWQRAHGHLADASHLSHFVCELK